MSDVKSDGVTPQLRLYKERGGINWCLCNVIAEYKDKIWIHNLHVGSMPVKNKNSIEFKDATEFLNENT